MVIDDVNLVVLPTGQDLTITATSKARVSDSAPTKRSLLESDYAGSYTNIGRIPDAA